MKPKLSVIAKKGNPLGKKSSHPSSVATGIPIKAKLKFYSLLDKNKNKVHAEAVFNVKKNEWDFTGDDIALINQLKTLFGKTITGIPAISQPNMKMKQDTMAFVYYVRDVLMPRKQMLMKIEGV